MKIDSLVAYAPAKRVTNRVDCGLWVRGERERERERERETRGYEPLRTLAFTGHSIKG